jgi:DegV family protein with EDD domain
MSSYCLITGSTTDLPGSFFKESGIAVMPYPFFVEEKEFENDPMVPYDYHAFYNKMRNGALPTTSNLNQTTIGEAVMKCFDQGKDVLYVAFSSELSSTYHVAATVQENFREQYPDRKLALIDSHCGSLGQGILVQLALRYMKQGLSLEENEKKLNEMRHYIQHFFTVSDLGHLFRGGRISRTVATVGKIAAIKPILTINREGKLVQSEKVSGRKKSISTMAKRCAENPPDTDTFEPVYVVHGDCMEDAQKLCDAVKELTGVKNVEILMLGPVIGAHTGPDALCLIYLGKNLRP